MLAAWYISKSETAQQNPPPPLKLLPKKNQKQIVFLDKKVEKKY